MKNNCFRRHRALFFLCLSLAGLPPGLRAQWAPQADSIFGPSFTVQAVQAADSMTVWAGVSTAYYSTVPTLRPWILRTVDGGDHWAYDTIPGTAGYLVGALAALDANTCWASLIWFDDPGRNRLYRTTDGGKNWQLQLEDRTAGGIVHFFDPLNGVAFNRNSTRFTTDSGATWSAPNALGLPDSTLFLPIAGTYDAAGDTILVTTVLPRLARSTDKGHSWELVDLPFMGADNFFSIVSCTDGQNAMAASPYYFYPPQLFTTADGGLNWSKITPPKPVADEGATVEAVEAIPGRPGWYLLQCTDFNLNIAQTWLTKNNGADWTLKNEQEALNYAAVAVDFVSDHRGWTGLNGFPVEGACVYRWDASLPGIKGDGLPDGHTPAAAPANGAGRPPLPPGRIRFAHPVAGRSH